MEEEDGESDLKTSEIDWGEEENHSWIGGGESDNNSWEGETDSEISMEEEEFVEDIGSEKEPEPPDIYQHEIGSIDWSREEADQEANHESKSWQVEAESQISRAEQRHYQNHEEENHGVGTEYCLHKEADDEFEEEPEPWQHQMNEENNSHVSFGETGQYEEETWNQEDEPGNTFGDDPGREELNMEEKPWCEVPYSDQEEEHQDETDSQFSLNYPEESYQDEPEGQQDSAEENEILSEAGRDDDDDEYEPRYITFSGYNQGRDDYFRWEKDMEDWFQAKNIPEKKKTMYAEETLTKNSYRHWEHDSYVRLEFGLPEYSWEEMKKFLHKELDEDAEINQESEEENYTETDRLIMAVRSSPKAKPKKTSDPMLRDIMCNPSTSRSKAKEIVKLKPKVKTKEPKAVKKKINQQEKISHQRSLQAPNVQGYSKDQREKCLTPGATVRRNRNHWSPQHPGPELKHGSKEEIRNTYNVFSYHERTRCCYQKHLDSRRATRPKTTS
ncbi:hypothetical protein Bca4012_065547 [Brassica carinata]